MKRIKRHIHSRSCNGYASWLALLCLALTLEIVGYGCIWAVSVMELQLCSEQSEMDLACLSYARHIVSTNTWVRRCHGSEQHLLTDMDATIDSVSVHFQDHGTYVLCSYEKKGKHIMMKIYYDDKSIVGMDIDSD